MFTGHGGTGITEAKTLGRPVLDVSASIAPFPAPTAADLRAACLKQGLLIRDASNFEGLDSHYFRVAVRVEEENSRMA